MITKEDIKQRLLAFPDRGLQFDSHIKDQSIEFIEVVTNQIGRLSENISASGIIATFDILMSCAYELGVEDGQASKTSST